MKLAYIDICGFRGYRAAVRIDFASVLTVIDGRNGVGKSTVFDAVEFALTGSIAKYGDAKADGETVADYFWFTGQGSAVADGYVDKYVEVCFRDEAGREFVLRRSQFKGVDPDALAYILGELCDQAMMPKSPLPQLCAASIIRDEQIATLSVDLKETERYALIRDAIGATDAEDWVDRGAKVLGIAKAQVQKAESVVNSAANRVSAASQRIDELRASLVDESALTAAAERMRLLTGSTAAPDQLVETARAFIAATGARLNALQQIESEWASQRDHGAVVERLTDELQEATHLFAEKVSALEALAGNAEDASGEVVRLATMASDLAALLAIGRRIGRIDERCPLCRSEQDEAQFQVGLTLAEQIASQLDTRAMMLEKAKEERRAADTEAAAASDVVASLKQALAAVESRVKDFRDLLVRAQLSDRVELADVQRERESAAGRMATATEDLRVLETLKLNTSLERALKEEVEAKKAYVLAEQRLGAARLGETRAQALHDAARRAIGETVNRRLERVLPLMAELYRRLRPHPLWGDIDYKVRGDVRRFMKLQVGDELNPQFMFSSGQRRATGLAFLLSVNLGLAWSRWKTLLLDDPVQHIDDFRSVHLGEVLAQMCASGRQIVVAVEDQALAEMLCRRLPITSEGDGKRISLGVNAAGDLAKLRDESLVPLLQGTLVPDRTRLVG